jgi:prepilin-type N-terminal cleavage/methylation domain-containing protein
MKLRPHLKPVRPRWLARESRSGHRSLQSRPGRAGAWRTVSPGVTLLEMLIVVAIIGTIASVAFPALTSGLAGVRLSSASSDVASFLTSSMNTVERREQAAAIVLSPKESRIDLFTAASGMTPARTWQPPSGITLEGEDPHRYLLFPGGAFPQISVVLRNEKGVRRAVKIDPVTAVPQVTRLEDAPK